MVEVYLIAIKIFQSVFLCFFSGLQLSINVIVYKITSNLENALNPFYNRDQKRLRTTWRLLLQWLLYLIPTSLATVALLFAQTSFFQLNGRDLNGPVPGSAAINDFLTNLTSGIFLSVNSVVTLLILLGTILLAAKWIDKRKLSDYGFHFSRRWFRDLGFGMLLGAVLMCFIFLFEWAIGWIKVGPIALIPNPAGFSWIILIIYLLGFTAVGIYEELLFRGYQLRNLAEGFK